MALQKRLPAFLKEVDSIALEMTADHLRSGIRNLALFCPEENRERFLTLLKMGTLTDANPHFQTPREFKSLNQELEEIQQFLESVEEEKVWLDSDFNEEWDDWYDSVDSEFTFTDSSGILPEIRRAIGQISACMDLEAYDKGLELAKNLASLQIAVHGEYDGTMTIKDLDYYDLIPFDYDRYAYESLQLAYLGTAMETRPEALYFLLTKLPVPGFHIDELLQHGTAASLPEMEQFLLLWSAYLGNIPGKKAAELLLDAQNAIADDSLRLENIRAYGHIHPSLYVQILQDNLQSGTDKAMQKLGQEALQRISPELSIRGTVAKLTAEFAKRNGEKDLADQCRLESFLSAPKAENYLRFILEGSGPEHDKRLIEAGTKIEQLSSQTSKYPNSMGSDPETARFSLSENNYCALLFLAGEYDKMMKKGMSTREALGWSYTFMKQGIALMLLKLFQGEALPEGLRAMRSIAMNAFSFSSGDYCLGTARTAGNNEEEQFYELFKLWNGQHPLSDSDRNNWLKKLDNWIEKRVQGIMDANKRKYYDECAAFIAALGEVKEALGTKGAKEDLLQRYRADYSRRRAFHESLRSFGMLGK